MRKWEESGESQRAIAQTAGVSVHTFQYWRAKLQAAAAAILDKPSALLRQNNKQLLESIEQLKAQNAELRRMLLGRRSEKMPSMASGVRRAMEADGLVGPAPGEPTESASSDAATEPAVSRPRRLRSGGGTGEQTQ